MICQLFGDLLRGEVLSISYLNRIVEDVDDDDDDDEVDDEDEDVEE